MKRLGWVVLTFVCCVFSAVPASALETTPTLPNKTAGPLQISGYSFSGAGLRYIQIYNNSSNLVALDGWQIASSSKTTPLVSTAYITLSGQLQPNYHVIAAIPSLVDRVSFELPVVQVSGSTLVGSVSLIAPQSSGYLDEVVSVPTVSSSTLKETLGSTTNYYLKRDTSATTGNYLSGFSFIVPSEKLENDHLYTVPEQSLLQIVQIYPDSLPCSPFEVSLLCADYVKIFNASSSALDLSQYRLRAGSYGQAATTSNSKAMAGIIESGEYTSVPLTLSSTGSWIWLEDVYGIARYDKTAIEYPATTGHDYEAWSYDSGIGDWRWTSVPTPGNASNTFPVQPEINACPGIRINEIVANVPSEQQYIELHNTSNSPVSLKGCAVQTNRSLAVAVLPDTELLPDAYISVFVKDTGLTLTKTTSGSVYILSSDLVSEIDTVSYSDLAEASSWSNIDGEWQQSFTITPNTHNVLSEYPECSVGYYRNLETSNCNKLAAAEAGVEDCGVGKYRSPDTNRCRSLEALATALTPCDDGQYRNPDTNRCRSLVSAASALLPCAVNQERNLETNRCRATATSSELKPCAANQERNPDTNRCRNETTVATADFPVEAVAQTGEATIGWWAFGGVGALAAGYAGWEWRREVTSWVRKVLAFGIARP